MADPITRKVGLDYPGEHAAAVTPSDTANLTHPTRYLFIGGAGNVKVDMLGGELGITLTAIAVGVLHNIAVTKVYSTGTTATNIVAVW